MSHLLKRRSRSETRKEIPTTADANCDDTKNAMRNHGGAMVGRARHTQMQQQQHRRNPRQTRSQQNLNNVGLELAEGIVGSEVMGRRKTLSELINEAKTFLGDISATNANDRNHVVAVGGVRTVSTRRPITPREPGRVLYGKVALAGRPPSSFSMRYLQNESLCSHMPKTPNTLLPLTRNIGSSGTTSAAGSSNSQQLKDYSATFDFNVLNVNGVTTTSVGSKLMPRKLPALDPNVNRNPKATPKAVAPLRTLPPSRNGDLLTQSNTETLIEMLRQHAGLKDCSDETVKHINAILVELFLRVRRQAKPYKRGFILGGLYGLVECTSPKILLGVARVVLALRVTSSNLTGACKLIFKVARHEQNDSLFYDNDLLELLIDGLGNASPIDDPETCIYGYGSIRFLTTSSGQERSNEANDMRSDVMNKNWSECLDELQQQCGNKSTTENGIADCNVNKNKNLSTNVSVQQQQEERYRKLNRQYTLVERLARHGAVELMILHLQILNEAGANRRLTGPPLHSLYQLSAALRALADVHQTSDAMGQTQCGPTKPQTPIQLELACPHLIRAAEVAMGELEVQANIVRTLSVLSEVNDCCEVLVNYAARIGQLLGPCGDYDKKEPTSEKMLTVLSRLGFILGNVLAKHDTAREQYYQNDVAMEHLLNVLELYSKAPTTLCNSQGDTVIDVLVKMIRVVANMSVNAEVGYGLGNIRTLGTVLLNLLNVHANCSGNSGTTPAMKSAKSIVANHQSELLHATLGALHNLCFYQQQMNTIPAQVIEAKGSLHSVLPDLATTLCIALHVCPIVSTQVEIARVLGNLTRNENARRHFCRAGGLPLIVQHLTRNPTQNYDLKTCAIGVLVNLLGDSENREPFLQLKGGEVLSLLLSGALEQEDWFLATIVCQAIWNLLIDASCAHHLCESGLLEEVSLQLAENLDEDRIYHGQMDNDTNDFDALWEDFAVVATDLLERIQNNLDKNYTPEDTVKGSYDGDMILGLDMLRSGKYKTNDDDDVFIDKM